jgi:hypothetical protein
MAFFYSNSDRAGGFFKTGSTGTDLEFINPLIYQHGLKFLKFPHRTGVSAPSATTADSGIDSPVDIDISRSNNFLIELLDNNGKILGMTGYLTVLNAFPSQGNGAGVYEEILATELVNGTSDTGSGYLKFSDVEYDKTVVEYGNIPGEVQLDTASFYRLSFLTSADTNGIYTLKLNNHNVTDLGNSAIHGLNREYKRGETLIVKRLLYPQKINNGNKFNFNEIKLTMSMVPTYSNP